MEKGMEEKTLLIIDDDVKDAGTLADMLGGGGYPVHLAHTKDEALNLVLKIKPSVIFVKAVLMDSSGYEIIRDIRKWDAFAETPFIIMTAVEKRYDDRSRLGYKNVHTMKTPINANDALRKTAELIGVSDAGHGTWEGSDPGRDDEVKHEFVDEAEGGDKSEETVSEAFSQKPSGEESVMSKEFSDADVPGGGRGKADGFEDTAEDSRHAGYGEKVYDAEIVEDESEEESEEESKDGPEDEDFVRKPELADSRRKALLLGAAAVFIVVVVAVVYFVFIKEKLSGDEPVKTQQTANKAVPETKPETKEDVTAVETGPAEKHEPPAGQEGEKTDATEAVRVESPPAASKDKPLEAEAGKAESGKAESGYDEKHATKPTEKPLENKSNDKKETPAKKESPVKKESVKVEPPPAEKPPAEKSPAEKPVEANEKPAAVKERPAEESKAKQAGVSEPKKGQAQAPAEKRNADKSSSQEPAAEKKNERKTEKEEAATSKKDEGSADASKPEDGYRLQAGYFSKPANAKKLADDLRKSGYDVSVEETAGKDGATRHKVMVGRYKSLEEALKAKDKLKAEKKVDALLKQ